MQVLKEICDKDPLNATYVRQYIQMLLQSKKQQVDAAGNPESSGGLTEAVVAEAKKVYESSLRYNAT